MGNAKQIAPPAFILTKPTVQQNQTQGKATFGQKKPAAADAWGDLEPDADGLDEFDYKNTDLNKCSDYELKKHKKKMDENFM